MSNFVDPHVWNRAEKEVLKDGVSSKGVKDGIHFKDKIPVEDGHRNGWNAILNAQNLFKGQKEMIKKKYFRREREIRSGSKRSHSPPARILRLRIPRDGQVLGLTDSWLIVKKERMAFHLCENGKKEKNPTNA